MAMIFVPLLIVILYFIFAYVWCRWTWRRTWSLSALRVPKNMWPPPSTSIPRQGHHPLQLHWSTPNSLYFNLFISIWIFLILLKFFFSSPPPLPFFFSFFLYRPVLFFFFFSVEFTFYNIYQSLLQHFFLSFYLFYSILFYFILICTGEPGRHRMQRCPRLPLRPLLQLLRSLPPLPPPSFFSFELNVYFGWASPGSLLRHYLVANSVGVPLSFLL